MRKEWKAWVDKGMSWVDPRKKPDGWKFGDQEKRIPNEFL